MATPHISAEKGDFAKTVLMPGDPLRAKFIADTFLKDVRQVTGVRGMLGFTGTYEGRPISVMGSGMGMPSIGIYSYELFKFYDVDNIIRIGSAGSYTDSAKLFDTVLATGAVSESNYARVQSGNDHDITFPSEELNDKLRASAKKQGIKLIEGNIHSSDVFYRQPSDAKPTYWELLRDERGCLCVEMESFALFANAEVLGKNAACLLTISDSFVSPVFLFRGSDHIFHGSAFHHFLQRRNDGGNDGVLPHVAGLIAFPFHIAVALKRKEIRAAFPVPDAGGKGPAAGRAFNDSAEPVLQRFCRPGLLRMVLCLKTGLSPIIQIRADDRWMLPLGNDPLIRIPHFIGFIAGAVPADLTGIGGILQDIFQGPLFKWLSAAGLKSQTV